MLSLLEKLQPFCRISVHFVDAGVQYASTSIHLCWARLAAMNVTTNWVMVFSMMLLFQHFSNWTQTVSYLTHRRSLASKVRGQEEGEEGQAAEGGEAQEGAQAQAQLEGEEAPVPLPKQLRPRASKPGTPRCFMLLPERMMTGLTGSKILSVVVRRAPNLTPKPFLLARMV